MAKREKIEFGATKENLVAIHFKNGFGNFIMMTPAVQALASMHNAKVDLILDVSWTDSRRKTVEEFCKRWDLINRVFDFQDGFNKEDYEQLYYSRHGENCEAASYFEKNAGYDACHINWRSEKFNEVEFYMNDVYELGYRGPIPDQYCFTPGGANIVKSTLAENAAKRFKIGLCNGFFAGSQWKWERKGWPHYPELVKLLQKYYGKALRVVLLGKGQRESEWAQEIPKRKNTIINFVDKLDINGTIQAMGYLDLFITTDTGLMHIADAMKIPTIALFGPTLVSKNGPFNKTHRIARTPLRCAPCQQSPTFYACNEWECMKKLTAGMVMSTLRRYVQDLITAGELNAEKPCLQNVDWRR